MLSNTNKASTLGAIAMLAMACTISISATSSPQTLAAVNRSSKQAVLR
jgi:predicted RND superfamily exporter protein